MIPDWFIWCSWVLGILAIALGAIYSSVWLGWWLYHEVELLDARKRVNEDLLRARAEHEKKLLNLEYEKAKVMSDQIIAASKE